jgi:hypothetical protein
MATTTPNYGWDVPTSTDYVKDGATAIETLGDDIDATLWTALGGAYPGLRLVKKQTIGTGVSSVTVTNAFSATYENYQIIVSGGVGSTSQAMALTLGASATGYYSSGRIVTYAGVGSDNGTNNGSSWTFGAYSSVDTNSGNVFLRSPFLAKNTGFNSIYADTVGSGGAAAAFQGVHDSAVSYTDFTYTVAGTLTGGTIYVYGYGAS